jgi:CRP/FNR family cyclic AMP-dependent transcriptional regulator
MKTTPPSEDPLMYLPRKAVQEFAKGQSIYDMRYGSDHLYVVILGRVKITNMADDGCQMIAGIVCAEGLFGESCLVDKLPRRQAAVTLDKVSLMAWTPAEIEQQIEREPRLGLALSQYFARRCLELQDRVESMAAYKTPERVMLSLVQLASELGTDMADGALRVPSLTHHTIAEYVGTSREIVTFQMNHLRRLGMLQYSRKHMDVYSQAIQETLCQHGVALPRAVRWARQAAG